MSDSYSDPQQNSKNINGTRDTSRGGARGGRVPGNRDSGGFRIRLSDNEMRAARALQEAFNLRSTVAVLGFALRTLGQMLEDGRLDELVKEYRAQSGRGGNRTEERGQGARRDRFNVEKKGSTGKGPKPNPFARPAKPQATPKSLDEGIEETQPSNSDHGQEQISSPKDEHPPEITNQNETSNLDEKEPTASQPSIES